MASFSRQFTSSPVLTMSPQPSHQSPFGMAGFSLQNAASPRPFGATPFTSSMGPQQRSTTPISRKRSRDEASINLEPDAPPPPPSDPEAGWVYGPGMTLIKPDQGYTPDAGTQSGTWVEEKHASDEAARRRREEDQRPIIRSHKSQRLDRGTGLANSAVPSPLNNVTTGISTNTSAVESKLPVVDNFTIHLGIGWKRISEDSPIQAAARGWARFIENHYPVTNVHVRLESKALQSYLVECTQGFFLFSENLRQGRLVSNHIVGALQNLQSNPPTFNGVDTLYAVEPQKPAAATQPSAPVLDAEMVMD
jgi:hypothetical protein